MARVLPLLLVALLALPAAADARRPCAAKRSTTVQENRHVRVYGQVDGEVQVYACSLRSGKRVYMGVSTGWPDWDVEHISLAGRRVAWAETECHRDGTCSVADVVVADLRPRRPVVVRHRDRGRVFDLVLTAGGAIAWIAFEGPSTFVLFKADAAGVAELARGGDLVHDSLAVAGSRVYWTQAGAAHTVTLTGAARP